MATYDARPSAFTQLTNIAEWEYLMSAVLPNCIDASIGNAMAPSLDTPGRNAVIQDGVIVLKGQLWRCDAPVSTAIPAASAQNRIDRLVIRLTRGATTAPTVVQPAVVTGTPSGSPVIPALTQTTSGIWEYPVSHWTATSAGALTSLVDDRRMTNDSWHDMRPLTGGFSGSISGYAPPQFRFSDDLAFVEVAGHVQTPSASGNYNGTVFCTVSERWRPVVTPTATRWPVTAVADGAATPVCQIHNDGTFTLQFLPNPVGQTVIGIFGRYPLEDSNGYITS